ncbi:MAG: secondary thiamine-phosphate synthase enzyme YjbQ [Hyphomicrobiales bacterium]|nr:secondary thiamine-phosphate synthase enzyme YjbQ [Hyphomicrobiales bacterium]
MLELVSEDPDDTPPPIGPVLQATHSLGVETTGPGFIPITEDLGLWLRRIRARDGLLTVFIAHTSASLVIQENADPAAHADLMRALDGFAPEHGGYSHADEGPDDMPAHIKAMLTSVSLSIPVVGGRAALGVWQGVYVVEHRAAPHRRKVSLHFIGCCDPQSETVGP